MNPSKYPIRRSRVASINGCKPALDRIDAYLKRTNPAPAEDETEKIKKVMLILFGPEPDSFYVPPEFENEPI